MTPQLIVRTDDSNLFVENEAISFINKVIETIVSFEYSEVFGTLIGSNQVAQRVIVKNFQNQLCERLNESIGSWGTEISASSLYNDAFDIYTNRILDGINYHVIIELDKPRADQIAKKFISRVSHTIDEPIIYFAFCYPGTARMRPMEVRKYFEYFSIIATKMNFEQSPKIFLGLMIE